MKASFCHLATVFQADDVVYHFVFLAQEGMQYQTVLHNKYMGSNKFTNLMYTNSANAFASKMITLWLCTDPERVHVYESRQNADKSQQAGNMHTSSKSDVRNVHEARHFWGATC